MTQFSSLEPEDRRELLRSIGTEHGLNILIETGTNQGLTPLVLQDSFKQIYTIELDDNLFRAARDKFAQTNVVCLHGDSSDVLPRILEMISEPALVWLDGHYSGPGTAHGKESSPIREELRILFEDDRPHIILIDDARIFEGGPEHTLYDHYLSYPSLEWVEEYANKVGYTYLLEDDIIRLLPQ